MFVGRIATALAAVLVLGTSVQAQTRIVAFADAEAHGAVYEVVKVPVGCKPLPPRTPTDGSMSALIAIDCERFRPPSSPSREGPPALRLRLFSRMQLTSPWVVRSVTVTYVPAPGMAQAQTRIVRPTATSLGNTRNPWTEIDIIPAGATRGTLQVTVLLESLAALLPAPLPVCMLMGWPLGMETARYMCTSNADCESHYRCASECANTCVLVSPP